MEFKVTINCPDLHDAFLALAEAISSHKPPVAVSAPAPVADETHRMNAEVEAWSARAVAPPVPVASTDNWAPQEEFIAVPPPQPMATVAPPQQTAPVPPPTVAPVNQYTLQQIAIWAVALQEKNQQRLMDILKHFGIQALTQLPHERFGEFVQMLALEGVVTNAR